MNQSHLDITCMLGTVSCWRASRLLHPVWGLSRGEARTKWVQGSSQDGLGRSSSPVRRWCWWSKACSAQGRGWLQGPSSCLSPSGGRLLGWPLRRLTTDPSSGRFRLDFRRTNPWGGRILRWLYFIIYKRKEEQRSSLQAIPMQNFHYSR